MLINAFITSKYNTRLLLTLTLLCSSLTACTSPPPTPQQTTAQTTPKLVIWFSQRQKGYSKEASDGAETMKNNGDER